MIYSAAISPALRSPMLMLAPLLCGALLAGCLLGGDLDTSTVTQVQKDTAVVILPPKDSTPIHDSVPIGPIHSLYPRLKAGEKWDFAQYSGADTGTTLSYEVVGDSVYGSDSVYIETYTLRIPDYDAGSGYLIRDYVEKERIYMRKTDQESVRDTITRDMKVLSPVDSVTRPYREEITRTTDWRGQLPDTLKDGVAWTLSALRRTKTDTYYGDSIYHEDDARGWTRSYRVKSSPPVTVKAGTFPAYELDISDSGSSYIYQVWFSPEAKFLVRQIDTDTAFHYADTTELTHLLVK